MTNDPNLDHFRELITAAIRRIGTDDPASLNKLHLLADPINAAAAACGLEGEVVGIKGCRPLPGHAASSWIRDTFSINRLVFETVRYREKDGRTVMLHDFADPAHIIEQLELWLAWRPSERDETPQTSAGAARVEELTQKQLTKETGINRTSIANAAKAAGLKPPGNGEPAIYSRREWLLMANAHAEKLKATAGTIGKWNEFLAKHNAGRIGDKPKAGRR